MTVKDGEAQTYNPSPPRLSTVAYINGQHTLSDTRKDAIWKTRVLTWLNQLCFIVWFAVFEELGRSARCTQALAQQQVGTLRIFMMRSGPKRNQGDCRPFQQDNIAKRTHQDKA